MTLPAMRLGVVRAGAGFSDCLVRMIVTISDRPNWRRDRRATYSIPRLTTAVRSFAWVILMSAMRPRTVYGSSVFQSGRSRIRGAVVGLLADAIVAIFQAVFETTLRVAGYASMFRFLRGSEASLLSSLSSEE
jgi:hypothetical protein